jgi:hypothetical protein
MPLSYEVLLGFVVQLLVYAFVQGRVFQRQKDIGAQLDRLTDKVDDLPCKNFCTLVEGRK